MFSSNGKTSTFLLLLSLLAICSPAVSAQNKKPEQISSGESQSKTLKTESDETKVNAVSEKFEIDKTTDMPNALQVKGDRERKIFKDEDDAETVEEQIERLSANRQTKNNAFAYRFRLTGGRTRQIDFNYSITGDDDKLSFLPPSANARALDDTKNAPSSDDVADIKTEGFRWRSAAQQSLVFLAVQHGYALTQPKTREALKGNFFKDYIESVKSLRGWADGGRFFTNYIAHPMQGSFLGYIQIQNDPKGLKQQFGASKDYWRSRLKALAWSAVWSTQFEIGPLSQASIGNVGLQGKQTYIDIVVTPTVGTAWLIGEDAIDRFLIKRIERATDNFYVKIFSRGLLNPTRTVANLFRFKVPWHRDRPRAR